MQLTKNFSYQELACSCCGAARMDAGVMYMAQKARDIYGKPMRVSSGYRCPNHNAKVGGAKTSFHMQGMAIDFAVNNPADRHKMLFALRDAGFTGFEISPLHIHVDNGPERLLWTDFKTIA